MRGRRRLASPATVRIDSAARNLLHHSTMNTILLVVLLVLIIGALPTWPHSSGWGYGPSGALGTLLVILLVLALLGRV